MPIDTPTYYTTNYLSKQDSSILSAIEKNFDKILTNCDKHFIKMAPVSVKSFKSIDILGLFRFKKFLESAEKIIQFDQSAYGLRALQELSLHPSVHFLIRSLVPILKVYQDFFNAFCPVVVIERARIVPNQYLSAIPYHLEAHTHHAAYIRSLKAFLEWIILLELFLNSEGQSIMQFLEKYYGDLEVILFFKKISLPIFHLLLEIKANILSFLKK